LAKALMAYVKAKSAFPRGALPRSPSSDRGIDWYPEQRLSWMSELLPYFGDGEFKELPRDMDKSWNEGDNLLTARIIVPQFLSPGDAKSARVHYPGQPGVFAATRFIGVAGVGLDAAAYAAGDASVARKVGVFGYDRTTKPEDFRDDPASTVALLQVPAGLLTPWMAGGGSTVRGVSEGDDVLKPFVCVEFKGKRGTIAVMADGRVRFIPETMKPEMFRAMCSIAGGGRIDDLAENAPVIKEVDLDLIHPIAKPSESTNTPPVAAK
jgi:hypothetical protein